MIGYQLPVHRVIDMLGLTDAYISHNPEKVNGLSTTWKERRFNIRYLLEQQPDFILFSTDYRPSAPAECALMLHSEFRRKYTYLGFRWKGSFTTIWYRKEPLDMSKDAVCPDFEFVNKFNEACMYFSKNASRKALTSLRQARHRLGEEYALITSMCGWSYQRLNIIDSAQIYFNQTLLLDSLRWEARMGLIDIAQKKGDKVSADNQFKILQQQCPWIFEAPDQRPLIRR
jgi:hypothetical protein